MHNMEGNLGHYLQLLYCEMACLPAKETKAYCCSKGSTVHLERRIQSRTIPTVEAFSMRKAAECMARYWQWCLHDVGPRWNDQLTQMGKDAIGQKELTGLATGFLTLLLTDVNGQSAVLCMDASWLKGEADCDYCDQCLFYMLSLLTENFKLQTDVAILICRVFPPDFALVDVSLIKAMEEAFPLKLC